MRMKSTHRVMLSAAATAVLGSAVAAFGPTLPLLGRVTIGAAAASAPPAAARVALVADGLTGASAKHGLDALRAALQEKGIEVIDDAAQVKTADMVIVASVASNLGAESLTIRK